MKSLLVTFSFFLFCAFQAYSQQDTLVKINGDKIPCKIMEVGEDQIKYIQPSISETIIYSIENTKLSSIKLQNGKLLSFSKGMDDQKNYIDQKKNAIKTSFIGPLAGFLEFSYEKSIKPGRSWEASAAVAGIGNSNLNKNGVSLKVGYKFLRSPDFYMRGMKYSHILKGSYIKPEIIGSFISYDETNYFDYNSNEITTERINSNAFAFVLNFGKQIVYSDIFLIDYYVGIGYSTHSNVSQFSNPGDRGGLLITDSNVPLAFTYGFRIGLLIK